MSETPKGGTNVVCTDIQTGDSESKVIRDDWIVITDGAYYLDGVQSFANGTAVITVKRGNPDAR